MGGLDTAQAVAQSLDEEFKEPPYAAPALPRRMVAAGRLGRKSGQGFSVYATPGAAARTGTGPGRFVSPLAPGRRWTRCRC
ncbi:3-hydroxyacyl-CoA dehydrogenase family protein [Streptomyces sp. NBC_01803]|nr:3-hydroxyacyl-CoA dehydrogenase family protein [Streptomyces sp. NBC_01803]WSA47298.1 3-hydroxyacyl-CoA dehydrogenase family protein [Streptomyces sp. NBC_01803]